MILLQSNGIAAVGSNNPDVNTLILDTRQSGWLTFHLFNLNYFSSTYTCLIVSIIR